MRRRLLFCLALAAGLAVAAGPVEPGFTIQFGPSPAAEVAAEEPSFRVDADDTLHWDGEPDRGFNISGTYTYGCAQRYTESTSVTVKAILYYLTGSADDVFVYAAGQGSNTEPGPKLDTTRANGQGGGVWKRANLPNPPQVPANEDFWACVIIRRHPSGEHPLTLDLGPIVPYRGGYITLPSVGEDWYQLTDPPFWTDRNVNIRAVVEREGTGVEEVVGPGLRDEGRMMRATILSGPGLARLDCRVLDVRGRDVTRGKNSLAPGVYFIREGPRGRGSKGSRVRKVVLQR